MENKKTCLRGRRVKRKLSPMERLGLAYCRLEGLSWDEHIGPKPEGFDEAPDNVKFFIVQRHLRRIEAMVGETYLDRCRWVFDSRRSEKSFIEFQARRWERGELTLGHRRNDVTKQRGNEVTLTFH